MRRLATWRTGKIQKKDKRFVAPWLGYTPRVTVFKDGGVAVHLEVRKSWAETKQKPVSRDGPGRSLTLGVAILQTIFAGISGWL